MSRSGYEIDFEYKGRAFAYLDAAERLNTALAALTTDRRVDRGG